MPKTPKVPEVEPKDLEYINVPAKNTNLLSGELDNNQDSENHIQDINNITSDNNLEEVRSSTSNKENQKFMQNFIRDLMAMIPLQIKKDCLYYNWNYQY